MNECGFNVSVRTQRLKQAKEEAEREASQYRSNMEDEYQNSISEVYIINLFMRPHKLKIQMTFFLFD